MTIPFWQWFLTRYGKKTAVYAGIAVSGRPPARLRPSACPLSRAVTDGAEAGGGGCRLRQHRCSLAVPGPGAMEADLGSVPPPQPAIPFLILVVTLPRNLVVTYIVAVAAGISVAATFLLPW